jgi:NADPH oxidase
MFGSIGLYTTAIANIDSVRRGEIYDPPIVKPKKESDEEEDRAEPLCDRFLGFCGGHNPDRQIARTVFHFMYLASNIAVGTVAAINTVGVINSQIAAGGPSFTYWAVGAKFFGHIIDFNYSIILIPVSHSIMRWLVEISRDNTFWSQVIRSLLWIMPVDDAIRIHKLIAYVGVGAAFAHTVCQLFSYIATRDLYWSVYGVTVFVTGGLLLLVIFILYPATHELVRRGHFELFWLSHMLYFFIFLFNLIHGKGTFGPNYWKYFAFPGTIYIMERIYREIVTRKPVNLISATFMSNNTISLTVAKTGALANYMEGQYAYICCPHISSMQWHPFTISSAPQEDYATFHIRIQGKGSWTHALREHLKANFSLALPGSSTSYIMFGAKPGEASDNDIGGIVYDNEGENMLRIHGPYSAPTQSFTTYNEVMICASGIGVTPLASALKSIVHFRWRYSTGRAFPNNASFFWVAAHTEIQSFRWLVRTVAEADQAVLNQIAKDGKEAKERKFRFNIFITSYKLKSGGDSNSSTSSAQRRELEKGDDDTALWGRPYFSAEKHSGVQNIKAPYTEWDIYDAMLNPQVAEKHFGNHITVYCGRPDWNKHFSAIASTTPESDVGVTFCGNPMIGADLKSNCLSFTKDGKTFHLHKEVF